MKKKLYKIIDWSCAYGNIIILYLGRANLLNWCGDDWDDAPYEHNAGSVYEYYYDRTVQLIVNPKKYSIIEACELRTSKYDAGTSESLNSDISKDDIKDGKSPMFILCPVNRDHASKYNTKNSSNAYYMKRKIRVADDEEFILKGYKNYEI